MLRSMTPAFVQACTCSTLAMRAIIVPSPPSVREVNRKASAVPQISAPAPVTVNVPLPYDALPAAPTTPTSCEVHGAGNSAEARPAPLTEVVSGAVGALLDTKNVDDRAPVAVGVNVSCDVQLAPGPSVTPVHVVAGVPQRRNRRSARR